MVQECANYRKSEVKVNENSRDGWEKARIKAVESHRAQKALRLLEAKQSAQNTLNKLELSSPVLDLAFAMLYLGEGTKVGKTSIASSDSKILKFVLVVLKLNYDISPEMVRCELHLRADQDHVKTKEYWSNELKIPMDRFNQVSVDKRSQGRPTYDHYKGVCVINCGPIAIQRKLINLYNLFCDKVARLDMGA